MSAEDSVMNNRWILPAVAAGCLGLAPSVRATVLFDLENGSPGMGLPITQTVGGITASFSSPSGSAFFLGSQSTTFWTLRQFSGNYLIPSNQNRNHLQIAFSAPVTSITLSFATIEYQDNAETPDLVLLTANSGAATIGTASSRGAYLGDTFPMGSLTFTSAGPTFDNVDIYVPFNGNGCTDFLSDNFIVQEVAAATAGSVPDGWSVPGAQFRVEKGVGGAIDLYWSPSCMPSDIDYGVYEGTIGDFTSHLARVCTTSGMTSTTLVPGVGSSYYLVVPHNGAVEGSYGQSSGAVERPASATACFAQALGACP
jgi:hypothetical protein